MKKEDENLKEIDPMRYYYLKGIEAEAKEKEAEKTQQEKNNQAECDEIVGRIMS